MYPDIHIDSVNKVFDDGNHNAFCDIIRFRDRFYLAFRSNPTGHLALEGSSVRILSSADGVDWEHVHHYEVPGRDIRDPHFAILNDTLFLYTFSWLVQDGGFEHNHLLGHGVWSTDGTTWSDPEVLEGTLGHYAWRAVTWNGKVYLNARRRRGFIFTDDRAEIDRLVQSVIMDSEDGLIFKPTIFFPQEGGDETAFQFEDDGTLLAVMRTVGSPPPHKAPFWRSKPPYTTFERTLLHRFIGGPMLVKWGDRYLVGGRRFDGDQAGGVVGSSASIGWLGGLGETPHLVEGVNFPSGGDTGYMGFTAISDTVGLLAYYSSHEGSGTKEAPSAIYVARVRV
jgi:hypothetical protein